MGILNFLNKAIVPGRAFTRMMYKKLTVTNAAGEKLKQHHHVTIDKDCKVWKGFLAQAKDHPQYLCRAFTDLDARKYATTLNFYSDAAKKGVLGFGAVYNNRRWIGGQWGNPFIEKCNPSIEFLELYALTAAILTRGHLPELWNGLVTVFCDNQAVMYMVNDLSASEKKCMNLIRVLALNGLKYNRRLHVKYVESKNNGLADAISRLNFQEFWRLAPDTMSSTPDKVSGSIWPISKVWEDFDIINFVEY